MLWDIRDMIRYLASITIFGFVCFIWFGLMAGIAYLISQFLKNNLFG